MVMLKGLDTTVELTRHAVALREQGYDFALRYYSHNAAKNLSLGEARAAAQSAISEKGAERACMRRCTRARTGSHPTG